MPVQSRRLRGGQSKHAAYKEKVAAKSDTFELSKFLYYCTPSLKFNIFYCFRQKECDNSCIAISNRWIISLFNTFERNVSDKTNSKFKVYYFCRRKINKIPHDISLSLFFSRSCQTYLFRRLAANPYSKAIIDSRESKVMQSDILPQCC